MGHYEGGYEAHYAEQRELRLEVGRKDIKKRLQKIADAMRELGMTGAGVIEEAIEHIKGVK